MPERDIVISNKLGLHARASAKLVQLLQSYSSTVWLRCRGREINAKSIMGVMMLAAAKGSTVTLETSGDDETEAMAALSELISSGFGEER